MSEKKAKKQTRLSYFAKAAISIFVLYLVLNHLGLFSNWRSSYLDWLICTYQKRPPSRNIVTITINDGDKPTIGGWPCDHRVLARLVNFLADAGAKTIVFDFFFKKPDPGDSEFLKSIKKHGSVVIARPWDSESNSLQSSLQCYMDSGAKEGHVAVTKQYIYHYCPLFIAESFLFEKNKSLEDNGAIPALALKSVAEYQNLNCEKMKIVGNRFYPSLAVDSLVIPMLPECNDKTGIPDHMIINYCGPEKHFEEHMQQFTISQILGENRDMYRKSIEGAVRGNIVLIYNTFDQNDRFRTPFSRLHDGESSEYMPGGEIHAFEVSNLLDRKFIRYDPVIDLSAPLIFLILGVIVLSNPFSLKTRIILYVTLIILWPIISNLLFIGMRTATSLIPPVFALSALFIAFLAFERKQFVTLFGDFVSHRLKDQVLMDASRGAVGTREVEATIVFADIRGFSTFSEKLSPGELTSKMTEYHTEMNRIFERNHGQILDYLGDAEMVGFGILGEDRYHPLRAIKSGLEMQIEIAKIRERWNLPGGQQFEVGVGICTGMVAEGIVGSEGVKKQLISMGDTTNTAARIQALSKDLDSLVTVSESTYAKVKDDVMADALKEMPLKGKTQKVMLYRIKGITEEALKRL